MEMKIKIKKIENPKQQQQQINKIFTIVYGLEMSSFPSTREVFFSHCVPLPFPHENLCNKMLINNTMLNNKTKTKNRIAKETEKNKKHRAFMQIYQGN